MSRTYRQIDEHKARNARRFLRGEASWFFGNARSATLALKGAKTRASDKCANVHIDDQGGARLDTWSECPRKDHGHVKRKIRRAGKLLGARQLEELIFDD